jgi:hypothetical protein
MCKAIKGVSGNPICLAIAQMEGAGLQSAEGSKPRDLLAVGYEDDSFIVYSMSQCFKPLFRGLGHRSFVSQIKFDDYYMSEQLRLQEEEAKNPDLNQQKEMDQKIGESTSPIERKGSEYIRRGNTLAQLLRQQTINEMHKSVVVGGQREYRIITGGEDGTIIWWNILHRPSKNPYEFIQDDCLLRYVNPDKLQVVRPCHEIHLSEQGQMYSIIVGKNILCIC